MRAFLAALGVAVALVAGYALLGGGDYAPTPVADACERREPPRGDGLLDPAQRATLVMLDGAACDLGSSREQVLLDLLRDRNPVGVSDDRVEEAVLAGIDRAEREDALRGTEATLLRLAVRTGGVEVLLGQLRR